MKIAEALREIKGLKGRLSRLYSLVGQNFYYAEDEKPEFDVGDLFEEIQETTDELRHMKVKVIHTNLNTRVGDITLAEAIIKLGDLRGEAAKLEQFFRARPENLYLRDERVIYKTVISEQEQVKAIEAKSREIELLDNRIQKANWQVDLE